MKPGRFHQRPNRGYRDSVLAHVPNHVAAAKKLVGLGPMEDAFEVGFLVEDAD
jgi:hypothetical protein